VFQDPYASLNPRMSVGEIVGEGLFVHGMTNRKEREAAVRDLLKRVGLNQQHIHRYPHEFSGGQRQRIGIARAIALSPDLVIADEPVSALDVSVQAQVLAVLADLRTRLGLALLFISHDLPVVRSLCDRVVVLYLGRIMEEGPAATVLERPSHPYTRALLSATPSLDPVRRRTRILLAGDPPSPSDPPSGCVFRTRCPYVIPACAEGVPPLDEIEPGHRAACIRKHELPPAPH
jgi:oligopeptide/dipeptide ABC transporter ATP-binding protein